MGLTCALGVSVRHSQPAVFEVTPERLFLPNDVPKCARDEVACVFQPLVLAFGPREEFVEERPRAELTQLATAFWGEPCPLLFKVQELSHSEERLSRGGVLCDGRRLPIGALAACSLTRTCDELVPEPHECLHSSSRSSLVYPNQPMPPNADIPTVLMLHPLGEASELLAISFGRLGVELLEGQIEAQRVVEQRGRRWLSKKQRGSSLPHKFSHNVGKTSPRESSFYGFLVGPCLQDGLKLLQNKYHSTPQIWLSQIDSGKRH